MDFWIIQDNFTIVIWQKYLLFWKWHDQGNNLGGCRSCYSANPESSIALPDYTAPSCPSEQLSYRASVASLELELGYTDNEG